jgi:hypothetical protein
VIALLLEAGNTARTFISAEKITRADADISYYLQHFPTAIIKTFY